MSKTRSLIVFLLVPLALAAQQPPPGAGREPDETPAVTAPPVTRADSLFIRGATGERIVPATTAEPAGEWLGRFAYNVAIGVAVAVLSTLILRAIL